jgi:hypothetical protein
MAQHLLFSQFMFWFDVNQGSSKKSKEYTAFHILFLSESESMIHCFSTCLYIVPVNGTSCTGSVFTKSLLAYFL